MRKFKKYAYGGAPLPYGQQKGVTQGSYIPSVPKPVVQTAMANAPAPQPLPGTNFSPYIQAADFAGSTMQAIAPNTRVGDYGGGALKGAAQGASIGSIIPGVGTLVGAGVGAVAGLAGAAMKRGAEAKAEQARLEQEERARRAAQGNYDNQVLSQYNRYGDNVKSYYAKGGTLSDEPKKSSGKLDPNFRKNWNGFVDYLETKGMKGSTQLDVKDTNLSRNLYQEYAKTNNLTEDYDIFVSNAQTGMSEYRAKALEEIRAGRANFKGAEEDFMKGLSNIDGWAGSRTTSWKFPSDKIIDESKGRVLGNNTVYKRFALGGAMPVGQGGSETLASDTTKFVGPSHGQGGIPVDTNQDGLPEAEVEGGEIQKGENIYSDRLRPTPEFQGILKQNKIKVPNTATYAKVAEILGKKKGKFESKLQSHSSTAINTGKAMTDRMDNLMEHAFVDQEVSKPQESQEEFAMGGTLPQFQDGGKLTEAQKRAKALQEQYYKMPGRTAEEVAAKAKVLKEYQAIQRGEFSRTTADNIAGRNQPKGPNAMTPAKNAQGQTAHIDRNMKALGLDGIGGYKVDPKKDYVQNWSAALDANRNKRNTERVADGEAKLSMLNPVQGGQITDRSVLNAPKPVVKTTPKPYKAPVRAGLPKPAPRVNPAAGMTGLTNNSIKPNISDSSRIDNFGLVGAIHGVSLPKVSPSGTMPTDPVKGKFDWDGMANRASGIIDEYGADILNTATYIGNQSRIAKMRAPQADFIAPPAYDYRDRSRLAKYENASAAKSAMRGVANTSKQGRSAEQAAILAEQMGATNTINNQENIRRDGYNRDFNNRSYQTGALNTQIGNQNAEVQTQVYNEKLGLQIGNQNAFLQGMMGNKMARDQEELDREKMAVILAQMPDPEKGSAYIEKYKKKLYTPKGYKKYN